MKIQLYQLTSGKTANPELLKQGEGKVINYMMLTTDSSA
jgi:hypothetical protein